MLLRAFAVAASAAVGLAATPVLAADPPQLAQCKVCHNFAKGQGNKIGPALYGVVGRKAGAAVGFNYSAAMKAKAAGGLVWNAATLDPWLTAPAKYMPGTKMAYAGLKDPVARKAVIAWLTTNK
jgi:cytochrome c